MAEIKTFGTIDDDFIAANDITNLKTRPNLPEIYGGNGMSAADLKARFDKLVKQVITEYNTLAKIFSGEAGEDVASYIALSTGEGGSLRGLLEKIVNANGALILDNKTISEIITEIQTSIGVVDEGENLATLISDLQTIINSFYEKTQDDKIQISADTIIADTIEGKSDEEQIKIGGVEIDDDNIKVNNLTASDGHISGNLVIDNKLTAKDISATGKMEVGGDLTVQGKTISQSHESLIVNDNIIVTNSSGASFSTSGLVIRIPVNENGDNAYGILYDPNADAVMVGIGKLNPDTYEFAYSSGQEYPLAARSGLGGDDAIPMWDGKKLAFVPSTKLQIIASTYGDTLASSLPIEVGTNNPTVIQDGNISVNMATFGNTDEGEYTVINKGNVNVGNTLTVIGNLGVGGNLDVGGNLNLKGKPIAQNMETLLVKDNIIVTNSSGADFSFSGIVMRTSPTDPSNPNSPTQAYGILYSPITKAVMIGEGKLEEITDATTGAVTYEFDYYVGKSHPLAARSGFNNIKDGYIPVWDADLYAFVPSDKTAESLATQTWVETYVAEYVANNGGGGGDTAAIAEELRKINEGGVGENG